MINRVVLVGRITRDPELKTTTSGKSVCSFTVALDNRTKNADGSKTTSFIPCVAFTQTAESMSKYTTKGSLVGVEGRLNQRSFVRQDGSKGSVLEVLADSVQFLQSKGNIENSEPDVPPFDDIPAETVSNEPEDSKNLDNLDMPDSDLPF